MSTSASISKFGSKANQESSKNPTYEIKSSNENLGSVKEINISVRTISVLFPSEGGSKEKSCNNAKGIVEFASIKTDQIEENATPAGDSSLVPEIQGGGQTDEQSSKEGC
jgi:hypothetical protein